MLLQELLLLLLLLLLRMIYYFFVVCCMASYINGVFDIYCVVYSIFSLNITSLCVNIGYVKHIYTYCIIVVSLLVVFLPSVLLNLHAY